MNYWHIQLHPGEFNDWEVEDIKEILKHNLIGCSGDPIAEFNKIKPHDIVMVRHGGTVIALVEVHEFPRNTKTEEKQEPVWFDRCAKIKILRYYDNQYVSGSGWYIPKTLMRIDEDNSIALDYVVNLYKAYQMDIMMTQLVSLLANKPQLILQGPPGTGKTRLAQKLATELVLSNGTTEISEPLVEKYLLPGDIIETPTNYNTFKIISVESGRIKVKPKGALNEYTVSFKEIIECITSGDHKKPVSESNKNGTASYKIGLSLYLLEKYAQDTIKLIQFHPAYSYEDFVRGIRVETENNQVKYITENRILGEIAQEAMANFKNSQKEGAELSIYGCICFR